MVTIYSGSGTITAGDTTVIITHGFGETPNLNRLVPIHKDNLNGRDVWFDTANSTTFTINISSQDLQDHVIGYLYVKV